MKGGKSDSEGGNAAANSAAKTSDHSSLVGSSGDQVRTITSKILLVDVFAPKTGNFERCYAIIDEQSSTSFLSPELADSLGVTGPKVNYGLSTMTSLKTNSTGNILSGLSIRGVGEEKRFDLAPMITNDNIPNCVNEAASPESVKSHPSINEYHKYFNPVDPSNSIMLLIGRDCTALMGTKCYGGRP